MTADPFADDFDTTDNVTEFPAINTAKETKTVTTTAQEQDGKLTITLKGGSGFESPWIVLYANDAADGLSQMQDPQLKELMDVVKRAGQHFSGGSSKPAAQPQQNSTPPQQQAPGGEGRTCAHGEMTFRSGVSKAGNAYKGFFCPERDRNQQCKPQFLK